LKRLRESMQRKKKYKGCKLLLIKKEKRPKKPRKSDKRKRQRGSGLS